MRKVFGLRGFVSLALVLALVLASTSALASEPTVSSKWKSFSGSFPVSVKVTDCTRINLRSSASTAVESNIVASPTEGTVLTALGLSGDFVVVDYNGRELFGYAAYLTPVEGDSPSGDGAGAGEDSAWVQSTSGSDGALDGLLRDYILLGGFYSLPQELQNKIIAIMLGML